LDLGLIERQIEVRDVLFIETIERDLLAVRRPPHRGVLIQFLAVAPTGRAILDTRLVAALGGNRYFIRTVGLAQPKIAIAIKRFPFAVGRSSGSKLATAFHSA